MDSDKMKAIFGESMYMPRKEDHEKFWKDFEMFKEDENKRKQAALDRAAGALVI